MEYSRSSSGVVGSVSVSGQSVGDGSQSGEGNCQSGDLVHGDYGYMIICCLVKDENDFLGQGTSDCKE
jgi:hypothetical protein